MGIKAPLQGLVDSTCIAVRLLLFSSTPQVIFEVLQGVSPPVIMLSHLLPDLLWACGSWAKLSCPGGGAAWSSGFRRVEWGRGENG